jgi:hypothetical protein
MGFSEKVGLSERGLIREVDLLEKWLVREGAYYKGGLLERWAY